MCLSVCHTTHQSSEFILEVGLMEATQVHFARLLVGGRLAVGVPDISGWSGYLKQQLFLKKRGVGGGEGIYDYPIISQRCPSAGHATVQNNFIIHRRWKMCLVLHGASLA